MAKSQNGYPALTSGQCVVIEPVPGRKFRLRPGVVADLFAYFIARYHAEVEPIDRGVLDDWSYASRKVRGSSTTVSNHASGTAIDLNATSHVLGRRNTFTAGQKAALRRILNGLDGCLRWGGDYRSRADEMHYEVNASEAHIRRTLARLGPAIVREYALGDRLLEEGATGPDVAALQTIIGADADGDFGPATKSALANWQAANGLDADGVAGPQTYEKINELQEDVMASKEEVVNAILDTPVERIGSTLGGETTLRAIIAHFDAAIESLRAAAEK